MPRPFQPRYDVATGLSQGARPYQEDAIVTDFPFGSDVGLAVLSDGMGGHEAGDVASKIAVTKMYAELKLASVNFSAKERLIPNRLIGSAADANTLISEHITDFPETKGMGATLVGVVLIENRLYWVSVGDSPLYLFRDGALSQLNEDHSMASQIDFMAAQGLIEPEAAKNHPDRNSLTSAITGEHVEKLDCPPQAYELLAGDIVLLSSDGLQYLQDENIEGLLKHNKDKSSAEIAEELLTAIETLCDPNQDNVSFAVIRLNHAEEAQASAWSKTTTETEEAEPAKLSVG